MRRPDPVGVAEIAERLDLTPGEIHRAIATNQFIPPRWPAVNGAPAWRWRDVEAWAGEWEPQRPIVQRYRERESA